MTIFCKAVHLSDNRNCCDHWSIASYAEERINTYVSHIHVIIRSHICLSDCSRKRRIPLWVNDLDWNSLTCRLLPQSPAYVSSRPQAWKSAKKQQWPHQGCRFWNEQELWGQHYDDRGRHTHLHWWGSQYTTVISYMPYVPFLLFLIVLQVYLRTMIDQANWVLFWL